MSKAMSVTELTSYIKERLESTFFYSVVEGEISNLAQPSSGHIYFNLKDNNALIRAVVWRSTAALFRSLLSEGQEVRVTGKVTVYAPRGDYQLIITRVESIGVGDLYHRYLLLRERLAQQGLFSPEHKRTPKENPSKIGLITSPTAAAFYDVLKVLQHHRPDIPYKLYPTLVQGKEAAQEIAEAIQLANREEEVDTLLLIRGGGSIEDLWPFNEEQVAEAIFNSEIPIITGIGHETDTTIADLVADVRGATPSVAAKYVAISADELMQRLDLMLHRFSELTKSRLKETLLRLNQLSERLERVKPRERLYRDQQQLLSLITLAKERLDQKIRGCREELNDLETRLIKVKESYRGQLYKMWNRLGELTPRLYSSHAKRIYTLRAELKKYVAKLEGLSPLAILGRGYSLIYSNSSQDKGRELVKSVSQVEVGDRLTIHLSEGELSASVLAKKRD